MGKKKAFYIEYLESDFSKKSEIAKEYSLRSYAKDIRMDPSFLSKVFSGKKTMSLNLANQVIAELAPNNIKLRVKFLKSVSEELACFRLDRFDSSLTDCE